MAAQVTPVPRQPFRWSRISPAQRQTLTAAALGWMLDAFDVLLYSIVLATLIRDFGMSKSMAGLLNTVTLIASAIGSFVLGLGADRFGRKKMLSFSILTYSVFTFACGLSWSIAALAAFRFLVGLGMGGEWNCGATLVAETWPTEWRGRALGIVQSSWAVGYALAALVAQLVLARLNWRWVFFAGVFPALTVFWIRRNVPEPAIWIETRSKRGRDNLGLWKGIRRRLLALLAMNTFGMFAWWGLFTWIPAYLALPLSRGGRGFSSLNMTSFLVILNLCGMLPGYLLFGVLADRFGRRRTLVFYLAAAALCVPAFAFATRPSAILITATVTAFFGTGFFTGSGIIGTELFPTAIRATALGISYNAARGLSAFAPLLIGAIGEHRGLGAAFLTCAVAFALAAFSSLFLPETRQAEFT
jgi:MFS family permease